MHTKPIPPVLLIVFNRLENTKKVFNAIREKGPSKLFIASDAHRDNIEGEEQIVSEVREFLINAVDWNCEVKTLFHSSNQGCKYGPQKAITWFFNCVPKGIVLEDDCVPSKSFFCYSSELLDKFENDFRIYGISGVNFQADKYEIKDSYYFSRFFMTWGWASWKTRWERHLLIQQDFENHLTKATIYDLLENRTANKHIVRLAKQGYDDRLDAWDYQWILSCIINNGLIATPAHNLIENIGFGNEATHTVLANNRDVAFKNLCFPLKHPEIIKPNLKIDDSFYKNFQGWLTTKEKLLSKKFLLLFVNSKLKKIKTYLLN